MNAYMLCANDVTFNTWTITFSSATKNILRYLIGKTSQEKRKAKASYMLIFFHLDIDQIWHYVEWTAYILIVQWTRNSDYDKTTHWFLYSWYDLSGLSSRFISVIVYAWILIMILLFAVNRPTYFILSF
jgi:hypothetical protein